MVFYSSADEGVYSSSLDGLSGLTHFFYYTSREGVSALPDDLGSKVPKDATVCFFRLREPAASDKGVYWHFDADGKPVIWQKAE